MTDPQMGIDDTEIAALTTDEERWRKVDKQFSALNLRQSTQDVELAEVKASVSENTRITQQIAADTSAMLAMWNDGVAAKRFFCRLADGWRFMIKQVFVPIGLPLLVLYVIGAVATHHTVPEWIGALFKLLG